MTRFLMICLGGAIGTGARYLISGWSLSLFGSSFAYGTLAVNLLGSFLIAFLMHIGLTTDVFSPTTRILLTTGMMGGFTTYSTFNYETIEYFQEGLFLKGIVNILIMVIVCLGAGILGLMLARRLVGQ